MSSTLDHPRRSNWNFPLLPARPGGRRANLRGVHSYSSQQLYIANHRRRFSPLDTRPPPPLNDAYFYHHPHHPRHKSPLAALQHFTTAAPWPPHDMQIAIRSLEETFDEPELDPHTRLRITKWLAAVDNSQPEPEPEIEWAPPEGEDLRYPHPQPDDPNNTSSSPGPSEPDRRPKSTITSTATNTSPPRASTGAGTGDSSDDVDMLLTPPSSSPLPATPQKLPFSAPPANPSGPPAEPDDDDDKTWREFYQRAYEEEIGRRTMMNARLQKEVKRRYEAERKLEEVVARLKRVEKELKAAKHRESI